MVKRVIELELILDDKGVTTRLQGFNQTLTQSTKGTRDLGRGMQRLGRNISISGFIIGMIARQIMSSFKGIINTIKDLAVEATNLDKATDFLSDSLTALALSGMLTGDRMDDLLRIFGDMMDNAFALSGPIAIIQGVLQDLKNSIVEGTIPAVTELADKLESMDFSSFKESLKTATENFLQPMVDKVKELLGEEGLDAYGTAMERIGALGGGFGAGVIQGLSDILLGVSNLVGEDKEGTFGDLAEKLGNVTAKLGLLSLAMTVTGLVVSPFHRTITALIGVVGGAGLVALAAILASMIKDWDKWKESIDSLKTAISELLSFINLDIETGFNPLFFVLDQITTKITGIIDLITSLINKIVTAISRLQKFIELERTPSANIRGGVGEDIGGTVRDTPFQYEGTTGDIFSGFKNRFYEILGAAEPGILDDIFGSRQGGGRINRTGPYLLHSGETVVPRNQSVTNNKPVTMNITIVNPDPQAVVREIRRVFLPI